MQSMNKGIFVRWKHPTTHKKLFGWKHPTTLKIIKV